MKTGEIDTAEKPKGGLVMSFLTGAFLSNDFAVRNLPYMLFLALLGILYIAIGYSAEKTVKRINRTGNEIKELRSEYVSMKSELELIRQQSHVAFSIRELELKESLTPPGKIVIPREDD